MVRLGFVPAVVVALTLAACGTGEGSQGDSRPGDPPPSASTRQTTPRPTIVRDCDRHHTGVGFGGVPTGSRPGALRVGPISLGSFSAITLDQLPETGLGQDRFPAVESIAVVNAGAAVTVAIPPPERRFVGLIYDQAKFRDDGTYRISDLDWVVRFEACKDPDFNKGLSQFDGGIVVAGRRCFHLDFWIDGHGGVVRRRVPVAGLCAAR